MFGVERSLKLQEKINYIVLLNVKGQNLGKDKKIKIILMKIKFVLNVKKSLKFKNMDTIEDIVMIAFQLLQRMEQKQENLLNNGQLTIKEENVRNADIVNVLPL